MLLPRMSSRRWFWTLMLVCLAWCVAGYRWDGDPASPRWIRKIQDGVLGQLVRVTLVPAEFVFGGLEGIATAGIERATAKTDDTVSAEALQEEIRQLQARNVQLGGLLDEARQRIGSLERLPAVGLSPRDVLEAHVLGSQAGGGSSLLHLDKGASSGVIAGMAVVAPLEQVTVLGRVVVAGQRECDVQLLSDPQAKTRADIVRDTATRVTAACIVEGMGSNLMRCQTVDVPRPGSDTPLVPPERGDFVRLVDPAWPANVQYMVIGRIDEVTTKESQLLRYDLRIRPLRPITSLRSVMIVVRE